MLGQGNGLGETSFNGYLETLTEVLSSLCITSLCHTTPLEPFSNQERAQIDGWNLANHVPPISSSIYHEYSLLEL